MKFNARYPIGPASISVLAMLCCTQPAHAQLLNLGDVITAVGQLQTNAAQQAQTIVTLDGLVDDNVLVDLQLCRPI